MSPKEEDLLRALDTHDELVGRWARGELSYSAFDKAYDTFYLRYALDGHESDEEELLLLQKHESRVALHREIWDVQTKITADEYLKQPTVKDRGFIGTEEARRRIRDLFERYQAPLSRIGARH